MDGANREKGRDSTSEIGLDQTREPVLLAMPGEGDVVEGAKPSSSENAARSALAGALRIARSKYRPKSSRAPLVGALVSKHALDRREPFLVSQCQIARSLKSIRAKNSRASFVPSSGGAERLDGLLENERTRDACEKAQAEKAACRPGVAPAAGEDKEGGWEEG
jgi:hypothetical protein